MVDVPAMTVVSLGMRGGRDASRIAEARDRLQAWLDDPGTDFGWMIIGDESMSATAKRFDSRESFSFDLTTNERTVPVLTVGYVPEPGSMVFLAVSGLFFAASHRRRC